MLKETGKRMLLLRFSNYKHFDFVGCHKELIQIHGFTWMMKVGKQLPQSSVCPVLKDGGCLILKAPKASGGDLFTATIQEFYNGAPPKDMIYPRYYQEMKEDEDLWMLDSSLTGSWFKITDLKKLSDDDAAKLRLISNGKQAVAVLNSTRTSVMYVTV